MKKILFTIGVIVASLSIMFITHARVVIGEYVTKAEVKAYYASLSEAFRDVTDLTKNKKGSKIMRASVKLKKSCSGRY